MRDVSGGVGDLEEDPRDHGPASPLIPYLTRFWIEEDQTSRLQTPGKPTTFGRGSREYHAAIDVGGRSSGMTTIQ